MSPYSDTLNLCRLEALTKDYRCVIIYNDTSSTVKSKRHKMKLYDETTLAKMQAYIKQYQKENSKSPTYRQIGHSVGISSPGMVGRYIRQLEMRELINKDKDGSVAIDPRLFSGRTRTASLVGTVACGMPILAEENIEGNYALPVELFGNEEHFLLHAKGYRTKLLTSTLKVII